MDYQIYWSMLSMTSFTLYIFVMTNNYSGTVMARVHIQQLRPCLKRKDDSFLISSILTRHELDVIPEGSEVWRFLAIPVQDIAPFLLLHRLYQFLLLLNKAQAKNMTKYITNHVLQLDIRNALNVSYNRVENRGDAYRRRQ